MNVTTSFLEKGILLSPEITKDPVLLEKLSQIKNKYLKAGVIINKVFLRKIGLLEEESTTKVKVLFSYNQKPGKITVNDFVSYFNKRFELLSSFLRQRQELQRVTSINRLKNMKHRETIAIIGLVFDKRITKNNNIILTLEDPSGKINIIISNKKKEIFELAKEIVLDELIGVEGVVAGSFVFPNQIFIPEIPFLKELKKGPEEECVAIVGDPHFGSKAFLKKEFNDFIEWINQRKGSEEQREIASKVKHLIIIGDLVEGVGIYPGQEKNLEIKDIKEQYDLFTEYLKKIPKNINIIICPGNHDIGRLSEPQPPLLHKYTESLQSLPNVLLLSNPAYINIGATKDFPGFDFLLYHGYSLIYYADNVENIRARGGQKRPDLIMKFLLQRRHLAPTHTSNLYVPNPDSDPLIINKSPDFFITGHIHRLSVSNYKNITLLNCSCWTGLTEDMEKRGLEPQPAKVPIINLKTREVKIINFLKEEKPELKNEKIL